MLIRRSVDADLPVMLTIINDAARAYRGVIPTDRWHEPYMSAGELAKEIADGGTWGSASWGRRFLHTERILPLAWQRKFPSS